MTDRADYYMKRFLQERERNERLRGFLERALGKIKIFEELTADMQTEIGRLNDELDKFSKVSIPSRHVGGESLKKYVSLSFPSRYFLGGISDDFSEEGTANPFLHFFFGKLCLEVPSTFFVRAFPQIVVHVQRCDAIGTKRANRFEADRSICGPCLNNPAHLELVP